MYQLFYFTYFNKRIEGGGERMGAGAGYGGGFALIVVLFILLIIIGASYMGGGFY